MTNTKMVFNLPYDVQRMIFRYVSTPTADLIKNLDFEKEYVFFDNRRGGHKFNNVFGGYFYNGNGFNYSYKRENRLFEYTIRDELERRNRLVSFELFELLDRDDLFLLVLLYFNGANEEQDIVNWDKTELINHIQNNKSKIINCIRGRDVL